MLEAGTLFVGTAPVIEDLAGGGVLDHAGEGAAAVGLQDGSSRAATFRREPAPVR